MIDQKARQMRCNSLVSALIPLQMIVGLYRQPHRNSVTTQYFNAIEQLQCSNSDDVDKEALDILLECFRTILNVGCDTVFLPNNEHSSLLENIGIIFEKIGFGSLEEVYNALKDRNKESELYRIIKQAKNKQVVGRNNSLEEANRLQEADQTQETRVPLSSGALREMREELMSTQQVSQPQPKEGIQKIIAKYNK